MTKAHLPRPFPQTLQLIDPSCNTFKCDSIQDPGTVTHTIHIPVMEKADKLTGSTIQAVIGLAVSNLCPKHGVRGRLWAGAATDQVGGGWGAGALTHRETHGGKGGMRGQKGEWHSSSAPHVPANSSNPKEGEE